MSFAAECQVLTGWAFFANSGKNADSSSGESSVAGVLTCRPE